MRTFVDTSALYALLDEDDRNHRKAASWFSGPGRNPSTLLVSHNYVVVEAVALVQQRLGARAVRVLLEGLLPPISILFVDERVHSQAVAAFLASPSPKISLVDRVSFQVMTELDVEPAFAFDRDFSRQGFRTVP